MYDIQFYFCRAWFWAIMGPASVQCCAPKIDFKKNLYNIKPINVGPTLAYCAEAYLYTSVYDSIGQTLDQ